MGKVITLRNLYRVFTIPDYPIPSLCVLTDRKKTGLTQTSFFQGICSSDFQAGETGSKLWRTSGTRNRYFSSLCNRTLPGNIYWQYATEIAPSVTNLFFTNQAKKIAEFLIQREYRSEELKIRITAMLDMEKETDYAFSDQSDSFFHSLIEKVNSISCTQPNMQAFAYGILLTGLIIYAVTDKYFPDVISSIIVSDLFGTTDVAEQKNVQSDGVRYLGTLRRLAGDKEHRGHYFGHETEVFDLTDAIAMGEKLIITGIGGSGKTEITRQVIYRCIDRKIIHTICLVQYVNSLRFSFRRVFSSYINSTSTENEIDNTLEYLSSQLNDKGLLVIDNLDTVADDDREWLARIAAAGFPVIITSRMTSLDGFMVHCLKDSTPEECLLIYRDCISDVMNKNEKDAFMRIMQNRLLCHPQTALLLGRINRLSGISIQILVNGLDSGKILHKNNSDDSSDAMVRLYYQLYKLSNLNADERKLAEFFALLPVDDYPSDWLAQNSPVGENTAETAEVLVASGFLCEGSGMYSMHPLVKQCIVQKSVSEKRLVSLLRNLCANLLKYADNCARLSARPQIPDDDFYSLSVLISLAERVFRTCNDPQILGTFLTMLDLNLYSRDEYIAMRNDLIRSIRLIESDDMAISTILLAMDAEVFYCEPEHIAQHYECLKKENVYSYWTLRFLHNGARVLLHMPEYSEIAIEMLQTVVKAADDESTKLHAMSCMLEEYMLGGHFELARSLLPEFSRGPECAKVNNEIRMECYLAALNAYTQFHDTANVERVLSAARRTIENTEMPIIYRKHFETETDAFEAAWYIENNEPAKAIAPLQHRIANLERLVGKNVIYISTLSNLALAYIKMQDYDHAEATYDVILRDIGSDIPEFTYSVILNNYAVLCIERENPEKAIPLLEQSIAKIQDQTAAQAEPYRNLGRAYDLLNDHDNAKRCWSIAYPLLLRNYGEDHERTSYAAQRLQELNEKCM